MGEEVTSSHVLVDHTEVFDDNGRIKTDVMPVDIATRGTKITINSSPPDSPQVDDIWIQIEDVAGEQQNTVETWDGEQWVLRGYINSLIVYR